MGKKLYVGSLSFSTTEAELREMFEQHGSVESVNVITDRRRGERVGSRSSKWMKTARTQRCKRWTVGKSEVGTSA